MTALQGMEQTGGEPDVIDHDPRTGELTCLRLLSGEPGGRRSLCYDRQGLDLRKEHKPAGTGG